jgi:diketogulonate reductase-like aldo/keto reductase
MQSTPLFQSRIGLGTWQMGEDPSQAKAECAAIRHALEVGYRLIDTAEMYADGVAESLVGMALGSFASNRREEVTLVSKVLPHHADKKGTIRACEASLQRMQCDYLDHYLLHWQGSHSFESTIEGFLTLQERGLIRHFGVSNFDPMALNSWRKAEANVGSSNAKVIRCITPSMSAALSLIYCLPWMRSMSRSWRTRHSAPAISRSMPAYRYWPLNMVRLLPS